MLVHFRRECQQFFVTFPLPLEAPCFQWRSRCYGNVVMLLPMLAARMEANGETKLRVLEDLLKSPVFGRSDQLRQLLRYIVQEEMEGRGLSISEYAIGVNALGRPAGYSPDVDSTVRTRAHELRRRLDEYYRAGPAGAWRLQLPKGAYQPKFVLSDELAPTMPETSDPIATPGTRPARTFRTGLAWGASTVALLASGLWFADNSRLMRSEPDRALEAVWGGMIEPGAKVTVTLATPPQLWIRDFGGQPAPVGDPPFLLPGPGDERFVAWYRRQTAIEPSGALYLHPNSHSPLWGEAAAAVHVAQFLAVRGVRVELLGEPALKPAALKDRNSVIIGRADYSYLAGSLHPANSWSIRYIPARREVCVVDPAGNPAFWREKDGRVNYGLATFLGTRTDSGLRRTVLVSGINSDGAHAALEYVTSPLKSLELMKSLKSSDKDSPPSFQVVVRTQSSDTFTLNAQKVAVRVLE